MKNQERIYRNIFLKYFLFQTQKLTMPYKILCEFDP